MFRLYAPLHPKPFMFRLYEPLLPEPAPVKPEIYILKPKPCKKAAGRALELALGADTEDFDARVPLGAWWFEIQRLVFKVCGEGLTYNVDPR